jgi:hypothetical protein
MIKGTIRIINLQAPHKEMDKHRVGYPLKIVGKLRAACRIRITFMLVRAAT